ncbi:L-alanine-DL-glutamate epimerase [hydrothermal vent metagenome]|uniref:L-alanine-DL-glutamate epimerase n=1 Tax=hydrothermal vent metagenome TaxID=652676 RepID=A0A1W1D142_9ZZZZ
MKITNIRTQTLTAPLKNPFVTALRRVNVLCDLVVIIETDIGILGYGEGASTPVITGETLGSMKACIEYITPHLIGLEIEDFESLITKVHSLILHNTTAKSALEIALYDLKSKSLNLPLYKMLGGEKREFTTDITISMGSIEKMIEASHEAIALGYTALKIKIGDNPSKDIERIQAIHASIDKNISLRLDANQGWTAKESVSVLHALEDKEIIAEFIEQPVHAHDIKGLKYIKERVQTPVLADESIFSLRDARYILEEDAVDYVNIKLAKTAGISQALKLVDLAKEFETKCMIGCMLEGPIAVSAAVHVASAKADIITMIDLDAVSLLASHPVQTSIVFDESKILLSDEVGLGVWL